jgi:hypothetical protein
MSAVESATCVDLMDMLERVFLTLAKLGLFQSTIENPAKVGPFGSLLSV